MVSVKKFTKNFVVYQEPMRPSLILKAALTGSLAPEFIK